MLVAGIVKLSNLEKENLHRGKNIMLETKVLGLPFSYCSLIIYSKMRRGLDKEN